MSARQRRALPAALLRRWQVIEGLLERSRAALLEQGSLAKKQVGSRVYWTVRYADKMSAGGRVQRSIYVGRHPYLLHRVRGWLEALRAERTDLADTLALATLARRLAAHSVKMSRQARTRKPM